MYACRANYHLKAFSLLEMLFAMTILVLLIVLAVPSYRCLVGSNRAQIYIDELVSTLEFARTYAIKTGESVIFCGSKNNQSCDGLWQDGMIAIMANSAKILKVLAPIAARDNLSWHGAPDIIFTPDGFANGYQGSFYYCSENATSATVVILSSSGRVRVSDKMHNGKKILCIYNK